MAGSERSDALQQQIQTRESGRYDAGPVTLNAIGGSLLLAVPPTFLRHNGITREDELERTVDFENNRVIIEVDHEHE